jgi:hypothetical protein
MVTRFGSENRTHCASDCEMEAHAFVRVDLVVERIPEKRVREFKAVRTSRPHDPCVYARLQVRGNDGRRLIKCGRQHEEIECLARHRRDSENLSAACAEAIGMGSDRGSNRAGKRVGT